MSVIKRTSVAANLVFLMVDTLDHITGKTGLVPAVTLSKNGASFADPSGAVSEIGNGWYMVAGNAADTGTLGTLILHASATGADPYDTLYEVVAFDPQDSIRLGLAALNAGNVVIAEAVVQAANKISARAADSWTLPINGLGDISARSKLWFSINAPGALDTAAKVFIEESVGLTIVNGVAYATSTDGALAVNDATLGDITVSIEEAVTAQLSGSSHWTVKQLTATGTAVTLATGAFYITKPGIEAIQ